MEYRFSNNLKTDANFLDVANNARLYALKKARNDLISSDPVLISQLSGSSYKPDTNTIETIYLGKPYRVGCRDAHIYPIGHERTLMETDHLLLLHGLLWAKGVPHSGKLVSYRELPDGGHLFYAAFKKGSIDLLATHFGSAPERMLKAADRLPCRISAYGDASVELLLLPGLPVTFVVWGSDEEFPASAAILFDSTATSYLHIEDLAVIGSFGAYEIIDSVNETV